ncbi:MAG: hypothetical protein ACR2H3_04820 [Acidimicrobiales bacterium]
MDRHVSVQPSADEIKMLLDALDDHEYWRLGDDLPKNDGLVFIPGDLPPDEDRYSGPRPDIKPEAAVKIAAIRRCRALAEQLRALI